MKKLDSINKTDLFSINAVSQKKIRTSSHLTQLGGMTALLLALTACGGGGSISIPGLTDPPNGGNGDGNNQQKDPILPELDSRIKAKSDAEDRTLTYTLSGEIIAIDLDKIWIEAPDIDSSQHKGLWVTSRYDQSFDATTLSIRFASIPESNTIELHADNKAFTYKDDIPSLARVFSTTLDTKPPEIKSLEKPVVVTNHILSLEMNEKGIQIIDASKIKIVNSFGESIGTFTARTEGSKIIFETSAELLENFYAISFEGGAIKDASDNIQSKPLSVSNGDITPKAPVSLELVGELSPYTNSRTPSIKVKAAASVNVSIYDKDNKKIGTGKTGDDGFVTIQINTNLPQGLHNITAKASFDSGSESKASETFSFTVDTEPPAVPSAISLDGEAQGHSTSNNKPIFTVIGAKGDIIDIFDNLGGLLGSAEVASTGIATLSLSIPLPEGSYEFFFQARDKAGNKSSKGDAYDVTVDINPPEAPKNPNVLNSKDGMTTGNKNPTLTIEAEAGSLVTITDANDNIVNEGYANDDGIATIAILQNLAHGIHTFKAIAKDKGNNESVESASFDIHVDLIAPEPPENLSLVGGITPFLTNNKSPKFSMKAEAGSTVILWRQDGKKLGEAIADAQGLASITLGISLEDGLYTLWAEATDSVGNLGKKSDPLTIEIDTTPTPNPSQPILMNGVNSNLLSEKKPKLLVSTEAFVKVNILDNKDNIIGTGYASKTGDALIEISNELADGVHSLTAQTIDLAGNASEKSKVLTITIDTKTPDAPSSFTLEAGSNQTDDPTPTLSISAEALSTLVITNASGNILGEGKANSEGKALITLIAPLSDGEHTLTVKATDAAGHTSSGASLTITVDTSSVTAPHSLKLQGSVTPTLTKDNTPTITLKAKSNTKVALFNASNKKIAETTTDNSGSASLEISTPMIDGQYHFTAKTLDAQNQVLETSEVFTFSIDTTAPKVPHALFLWESDKPNISNQQKPTLGVTAEAFTKIEIYSGDTLVGSGTTNSEGHASIVSTITLNNGSHDLKARAIDDAGNISAFGENFSLIIDAEAPNTPETPVFIGVGSNLISRDTTPTLSVKAEASSLVEILNSKGDVIGTAQANSSGVAIVAISSPLADGAHQFRARATDSAGNVSTPSLAANLTIDTTPPDAPSAIALSAESSSSSTTDATPTFSVTAEKGSTVRLFNSLGKEIGTGIADSSGNTTIQVLVPFSEGKNSVTASATDVAGNTSSISDVFNFTLTINDNGEPYGLQMINTPSPILSDSKKPTFTAMAPKDTIVGIFSGSTLIGKATAGSNNTVTIVANIELVDGKHTLTVKRVGENNQPEGDGDTLIVTVDTTPPSQPDAPELVNGISSSLTNKVVPQFKVSAQEGETIIFINKEGTEIFEVSSKDSSEQIINLSGIFANGTHNIAVKLKDEAGNTSTPSAYLEFTIDTIAPNKPVNLVLSDGDTSITKENRPTFLVNSDVGNTIKLYNNNGKIIGEGVVNSSGIATIQTSFLTEGTHTITARAIDAAQNISDVSAPLDIIVDALPPVKPSKPTVKDGASDSLTNDSTPTVTTSAEAGSVVIFFDENGKKIAEVTAGDDGIASYTFPSPLVDGSYTLTAQSRDIANNLSSMSDPLNLTIDTIPPDAPTSIALTDEDSSNLINNNRPTFLVKANPHAKVIVLDKNDKEIHSLTIKADGTASFQFADPLADGEHTFTIKTIDDALNVSTTSLSLSFSVDSEAPAIPSELKMVGGISPTQTQNNLPTFTVKTEPHARIEWFINTDTKIGESVATRLGEASFTPSAPLSDGSFSITAIARDVAGNSSQSSAALAIEVDTTPPATPSSISIKDFPDASLINKNDPTILVNAEAGATVILYRSKVKIAEATANAQGLATFDKLGAWADAPYVFSAAARDSFGNTSDQTENLEFTIDTLKPQTPSTPTLKTTGFITNEKTPTFLVNAEAGSTVTIYDNLNAKKGSALAGQNGVAEVTLTTPLDEGQHTLSATATDAAGNVSTSSPTITLTVDSITPDKPSSISLKDSAAPTLINKAKPTLIIKAEAGTTVELLNDDDTLVGKGTVGQDGNVEIAFSVPLLNGTYTVKAKTTDSAGNTSLVSDDFTFSVDTLKPIVPYNFKLSGGASAELANTATPSFTVNAEANSLVTLYSGSTVLATARADANGLANLTSSALSEGQHLFSVTSTDGAGNVSDKTDALSIQIDLTASDAPTQFIMVGGASDTLNKDTTPSFTITATPNINVRITNSAGETIGEGTADDKGVASVTLSKALANGSHTLKAYTVDDAQNISQTSLDLTISIDDVAPSVPSQVSFKDELSASSSNSATPTLKATSDPQTTIVFYINNQEIARGTTDADGNLEVSSQTILDGVYELYATAIDAAGNVSQKSVDFSITIDTTPPAVPTELKMINSASPHHTNSEKPSFSVKLTSGGTVKVIDQNDKVLHSHVALQQGVASFAITQPLAEGTHKIYVTFSDFYENTSEKTEALEINVDFTAPDVPSSLALTDGFTSNIASISSPTLSVNAEAGSLVEIYEGSTKLAEATASSSGIALITFENLSDGNHKITAYATDAAGNKSSISQELSITIDTTRPAKPLSLALVGGSTASITNDDTPVFSVKAEANSTVKIFNGDTLIAEAIAGNDGNASLESSSPLSDGNYTLHATVTDSAGNVSVSSDNLTITIDTSGANKPSGLSLVGGATANLTNDTTPSFTVNSESGNTLVLYDSANKEVARATANAQGVATLTIATPLSDGEYSFYTIATDTADNPSEKSSNLIITIDSVAPNAPSVPSLASGETSTNDNTPTFFVNAAPGSTVSILDSDNNVLASALTNSEGIASVSITSALSEGTIILKATATDAAGNTSSPSATVSIAVDTTPPQKPSALTLIDGATATLTKDSTPTFTVKAENGANVQLLIGGNVIGEAVANAQGIASITASSILTDNSFILTARAIDPFGNISVESEPFTFSVDSTVPNKPAQPSFIGIISELDYMLSNNNNIRTLVIIGEVGLTAHLYNKNNERIGTGVADGTSFIIDITYDKPLADGVHSIKAQTVDAAGNLSTFSSYATITIDTTAPNAPSNLTIKDDDSPLFINNKTPTFTVNAEAGSTVTFFVNDVNVGEVIANENGLASLTSSELSDGSFTLHTIATDVATNVSSPSETLNILLDTIAPDTPSHLSLIGGASPSLTRNTDVTIHVSSEVGSTVTLFDSQNNAVGSAVANAQGIAAISLTNLDNGSHSFTAETRDAADNPSPRSTPLTFVVDAIPPSTPQGLALQNGRLHTQDTTPTFVVNADAGTTVEILDSDNNVIASETVGDTGIATLTPSQALSESQHTFTAVATDAAGNRSSNSQEFSFHVDTTTPNPPSAITIQGNTDNDPINDNTPTLNINAEALATVTLIDANDNIIGEASANAQGVASVTINQSLSDGTHAIRAYATDLAGNKSQNSQPLTITIDTQAPNQPQNLSMDGTFSPSTSSDSTPVFSVEAEAGTTVVFFSGANKIGEAVANSQGQASITASLLSDGTHQITTQATDAAGNKSIASDALAVTIDTQTPDKPSNIALIGGATASLTKDNTPEIHVTAEVGALVKLFHNTTLIGQAVANAQGIASITASQLNDNAYSVHATATDSAGNESSISETMSFTVDTQISINNVRVSGQIDRANDDTLYTNLKNTSFNIDWPETGSTATILTNGNVIGQATYSSTDVNHLSVALNNPLEEGTHQITIRMQDLAGNTAEITKTLVIDATPPDTPTELQVFGKTESFINENTIVLFAKSTAGTTVIFFNNNNIIGETSADSEGNATLTLTETPDGEYNINARARDNFNNTSSSSANLTFTIDTVAPNKPQNLAMNGTHTPSISSDNTPDFSVEAEVGTTVTFFSGSNIIGEAVANSQGIASITASLLSDGAHQISAQATDAAGNQSIVSDTISITVDSQAPNKPSIALIGGASDSLTNDNTPELQITAEANSLVKLFSNDILIAQINANAQGIASFTFSDALDDNLYNLHATATDSAGNESLESDIAPITIDTQISIRKIRVSHQAIVPNEDTLYSKHVILYFFIDFLDRGSIISVFDENGNKLGEATHAHPTGNSFTIIPYDHFKEGAHNNLKFVAQDPAGNTLEIIKNLIIDMTPPIQATTPLLVNDISTDVSAKNSQQFSVYSEAFSTIAIHKNNGHVVGEKIGEAKADENGHALITTNLENGVYSIVAIAKDKVGHTSHSEHVSITVDTLALVSNIDISSTREDNNIFYSQTQNTSISFDLSANATVTITEGGNTTTSNQTPGTFSYTLSNLTLNAQHLINVQITGDDGRTTSFSRTVVFDNQAPNKPDLQLLNGITDTLTSSTKQIIYLKTEAFLLVEFRNSQNQTLSQIKADKNGDVLYNTTYANGNHSLKARVIDHAGNVSTDSDLFNLVVDTDVSIGVLNIENSETHVGDTVFYTQDSTPKISIEVGIGSQIAITLDGTNIENFTTTERNFSYTFAELSLGAHEISLSITDTQNNTTVIERSLFYDNVAPSRPTIAMVGGATPTLTNDPTPEFLITGETGSFAMLFRNGGFIAEQLIDETGQATLFSNVGIRDGSYHFTAKIRDKAGNISHTSGTVTSTIDTTIPGDLTTAWSYNAGNIFNTFQNSFYIGENHSKTPAIRGGEENLKADFYLIHQTTKAVTSYTNLTGSFTNGNTQLNLPSSPDEGTYNAYAVLTDPAGNKYTTEHSLPLIFDYTAPTLTPSVTLVGPAVSNNNTPTLRITGEENTRVFLRGIDPVTNQNININSFQVLLGEGITQVDQAPHPLQPFSDGTYDISARARDHAGNFGAWSDVQLTITIDTVAPDKPSDFALQSGGTSTSDTTPSFTLTTEAGGLVKILDQSNSIVAEATADENGNAVITLTSPLSASSHTFTARVDDAVGNQGIASDPITITVTAPSIHTDTSYELEDSLTGLPTSSSHADFGL